MASPSPLLLSLEGRGSLTVVVNTGDDFDWNGLRICPDLETVTYTLGGLANPDTGWAWRAIRLNVGSLAAVGLSAVVSHR